MRFFSTLSAHIGRLTALKHLLLRENSLQGIIPFEQISRLSALEILDLSHNHHLFGKIPEEIFELVNLRALSLGWFGDEQNNIRGSISTKIGLMTNLSHLAIRNTRISKTSDVACQCTVIDPYAPFPGTENTAAVKPRSVICNSDILKDHVRFVVIIRKADSHDAAAASGRCVVVDR